MASHCVQVSKNILCTRMDYDTYNNVLTRHMDYDTVVMAVTTGNQSEHSPLSLNALYTTRHR